MVSETMKMVVDDRAIEAIVSMPMDSQDRENVNLPLYEQQLRETDTAIQNLLLIDAFVNAILLYDDRMVITFSDEDGTDTVAFDDLKAALEHQETGSDLDCLTAP